MDWCRELLYVGDDGKILEPKGNIASAYFGIPKEETGLKAESWLGDIGARMLTFRESPNQRLE